MTAAAHVDRPIRYTGLSFTDSSVVAMLTDEKTESRRVVTIPDNATFENASATSWDRQAERLRAQNSLRPVKDSTIALILGARDERPYLLCNRTDDLGVHREYCPYGAVGDRIWVREAHWVDTREPKDCVIYSAGDARYHRYRLRDRVEECDREINNEYLRKHRFWKKRSSRFMPRWASRIMLELTAVRLERLHDITDESIRAEGLRLPFVNNDGPCAIDGNGPRVVLAREWDRVNARRGYPWEGNYWVWVLAYRRLTGKVA